jgi:hypothetical protein
MIMEKTLFYPNGSSQGFPVSSRNDILAILKTKADNIVAIDIRAVSGEYIVLARMQGDASWLGLGKVNNMI